MTTRLSLNPEDAALYLAIIALVPFVFVWVVVRDFFHPWEVLFDG